MRRIYTQFQENAIQLLRTALQLVKYALLFVLVIVYCVRLILCVHLA